MSPASYRAAPPRVGLLTLAQGGRDLQNGPGNAGGPRRAGHQRRETQPPVLGEPDGVGALGGEPDGVTDGPLVVLAARWAFWKSFMALSSAVRACPYLVKSPDSCADRTSAI